MKNLSQDDIANKLSLSLASYGKLEREEVELNIGRLEQIAKIFDMRVEDILTFDEKYIFNTFNQQGNNGNNHHCHINGISERERSLCEENIVLLKEKIAVLEKMMGK